MAGKVKNLVEMHCPIVLHIEVHLHAELLVIRGEVALEKQRAVPGTIP
jgi:hypothetical protein